MAFSALVIGGSALYVGNKAASAQKQASDAAIAQAKEAQAAQLAQARAEQEQTLQIAREQQAMEATRAAEAKAAQDSANAQAANSAMGEQNNKTSSLTPTVQLAASAPDSTGSATSARQRRAQFRPEYTSGVSI
jgi:hypothetical protein